MIETEHQQLQQADFPAFPVVFQPQFESQLQNSSIIALTNTNNQNIPDHEINTLLNLTKITHNIKYPQLFTQVIQDRPYVIENFLKNYHPLDQTFYQQLKTSKEIHIVRLSEHKVYVGELNDSNCHGKGIVIFKNGNIYEGHWQNNHRSGIGFYMEFGVGWYKGFFNKDTKSGQGTQVFYNKSCYRGTFLDGLRHQKGVYADTSGIVYNGSWKLGIIHGKGRLQTPKSIYSGSLVNWLKHGSGEEKFKNGDIYKGHYQNGRFDGNGRYSWVIKNATYQGNFRNGLREGKGKWQAGSTKYNGSYSEGLKQGYGEMYFPSGNFYKGNFVADKRQGYGEMFWSDGSFYKGQWKSGIQNGKGQIYMRGGEIISGLFQNSILVQALPSVYEKQMESNFSNDFFPKQSNFLTKQSTDKKRTFSEARVMVPKKRLNKIQQNTRKKNESTAINSLLYFRSPEKSQHTHGKQCKCIKRLETFRLRNRKKTKLQDSNIKIQNQY